MPQARYTNEEIVQQGNDIYQHQIRHLVTPEQKGKFLVLDIESGDYVIDADDLCAEETLRARRPTGIFFELRIGYQSTYTLSGRMIEEIV